MKQVVAVLGASHKPERYSNQAVRMLKEYGHEVIPVTPGPQEIENLKVVPTLADIKGPVDTLTLYVGPQRGLQLMEDMVRLKPGRVIFNPGTESMEIEKALSEAGIPWQHACTLVLLRTEQF